MREVDGTRVETPWRIELEHDGSGLAYAGDAAETRRLYELGPFATPEDAASACNRKCREPGRSGARGVTAERRTLAVTVSLRDATTYYFVGGETREDSADSPDCEAAKAQLLDRGDRQYLWCKADP